ncbi:hypothetical protein [Duganella levis]|jgi:hypothetical protein|uniref:Flp family type IVb pilin n=1 Tax=Duganella levis TaxID=2692169 RepID=A0ABW9W555_9BURK|nr:hypothetical protein [Duganella levis]MYN29169.1 hypothetical protein [Duganella levis]
MTRHPMHHRAQDGQSSMEFVIVCAALALALGIGMSGDSSVLKQLLDAFKTAYQDFSYAISLPG